MATSLEISSRREARLLEELRFAIEETSGDDLKRWGSRSAAVVTEVTMRRAKNFGALATRLRQFVSEEGGAWLAAIREGSGWEHTSQRAAKASARAKGFGADFNEWYTTVGQNLRGNPKESAPKLAAGLLGFLVGSGGVDGDGGVPDVDLLGGIGAHRSILTHSVLSGIVLESLVLSFLDLSRTVYGNLPEQHDELWDELNEAGDDVFTALTAGLSIGIAYHLGVDATLDGAGTYKDLPIELPQEGHQAILAGNAAVEGVDGATQGHDKPQQESNEQVFSSFREAADYAKERPGWVIVRATDTEGFRVMRKAPSPARRKHL